MKFINIHCHTSKSPAQVSIMNLSAGNPIPAEPIPNLFSVGIHPWHIKEVETGEILQSLENALVNDIRNVAIGEAGLDYSISTHPEDQKNAFFAQLKLSVKYQKPMIIHCVKAYYDLISFKRKSGPCPPWIFHGFNGSWEIANEILKNKDYLSFGVGLLKNSTKLCEIFKKLPLEAIFLEMWCRKAAELRKIDIEELKIRLVENFISCFGEKIWKEQIGW